MTKATDAQVKQINEALKAGTPLPDGVRVNFGDPEPFQKAESTASTDTSPTKAVASKGDGK